MIRILGIDPSLTATGVVLLVDGKVAHHDLIRDGNRRGMDRLVLLRSRLRIYLDAWQPQHVAIEGYSFGSKGSSIFQIGEWGGIVRMELRDHGLLFSEIPPGTWRKQLLGKGTMAKDLVRIEAFKRYGIEFESLDVLEAWAVAMALHRQLAGLDQPEPKRRAKGARARALLEEARGA